MERAGALHPVLAQLVDPLSRVDADADQVAASRKRNVIPARAEVVCDCRVLPGHRRWTSSTASSGPRWPGSSTSSSRSSRPWAARAPRSGTPLEDMLPRLRGAPRAGRRWSSPPCACGFTNSHFLRAGLRHRRPTASCRCATPIPSLAAETIHSADERIHQDDLVVAVRFLEHACRTIGGLSMSIEPLRLRRDGPARTGCSCTGPPSWAAAVRDDGRDGSTAARSQAPRAEGRAGRAAAGPRRRSHGRDDRRSCRTCGGRCPRRACRSPTRVIGGRDALGAAVAALRRSRRVAPRAGRAAAALGGPRPVGGGAALAHASPATTAPSTRRSAPTSTGARRPRPPRSTSAAARTSSGRSLADDGRGQRCRRPSARAQPARGSGHRLARRARRRRRGLRLDGPQPRAAPGRALWPARATRCSASSSTAEPTSDQLEVAERALDELLRAEGAPPRRA